MMFLNFQPSYPKERILMPFLFAPPPQAVIPVQDERYEFSLSTASTAPRRTMRPMKSSAQRLRALYRLFS